MDSRNINLGKQPYLFDDSFNLAKRGKGNKLFLNDAKIICFGLLFDIHSSRVTLSVNIFLIK